VKDVPGEIADKLTALALVAIFSQFFLISTDGVDKELWIHIHATEQGVRLAKMLVRRVPSGFAVPSRTMRVIASKC